MSKAVSRLKNQYFGDVGDYGKYGLLRHIANNGIKIAVNWYLTRQEIIFISIFLDLQRKTCFY